MDGQLRAIYREFVAAGATVGVGRTRKLAMGAVVEGLGQLPGASPAFRRAGAAAALSGRQRYEELRGRGFEDREVAELLKRDVSIARPAFGSVPAHRDIRAYDLRTYTSQLIIPKVDVASMRFGLEVRVPFLDHRLAEVALRLPRSALYNVRRGKLLLRELAGDYVGASSVSRGKRGFGMPLRRWSSTLSGLAAAELPGGAVEEPPDDELASGALASGAEDPPVCVRITPASSPSFSASRSAALAVASPVSFARRNAVA